jgi:hypothetical protein
VRVCRALCEGFAIADQLALTAIGLRGRSAGPDYVEKLSWPHAAHAGDDLKLQIEVLDKHVSASGPRLSCVGVGWLPQLQASKSWLIASTMLEERVQGGKTGVGTGPMAYKVPKAAAMLGGSVGTFYMMRFGNKNCQHINPVRDQIS